MQWFSEDLFKNTTFKVYYKTFIVKKVGSKNMYLAVIPGDSNLGSALMILSETV